MIVTNSHIVRILIRKHFIQHSSNLRLLALLLRVSPPPTKRRPTINLKRIPSDMRRPQTRNKQHQTSKVLRLANSTARLPRSQSVLELLHTESRHPAGEDTRTDNVHGDVLRHEFRRLHFGQVDAGCFGGAVGECAVAGGGEAAFGAGGYVYG